MPPSRGAAAVFRTARTRFREAWRRIDPAARRRWLRFIATGAAGMFAIMFVMVVVTQRLEASGALAWEAGALRWIGEEGPFSFSTGVWFQTLGTDITLWYLVAFTAGIAVWNGRPITALSIVLAYLVIDPVVRWGWLLWDRARPDVLYQGFASPGFHAFPSGHTGKTFAVYGFLIALWVRSARSFAEKLLAVALFALIAGAVPLGRLSMGVHWPSDVIAGYLLGAIWLAWLLFALRLEGTPPDRAISDRPRTAVREAA